MFARPRNPDAAALAELAENRELYSVLLQHAYRGLRVQLFLRVVLVAFVVLAVVLVPPEFDSTSCRILAAVYAAWSLGLVVIARRGGEGPVRFVWLALFVDLLTLASLTIIAGNSAEVSWTADLLINGFFLVPLLAATQLRPWVCTTVAVPTVIVYLVSSIASRAENGDEPWASVILRTGVLAGVGAGCVLLTYVQRSRVVTIGRLVADRSALLAQTVAIEERERRLLAENLHDGALQYVLAARMDLDDARDTGAVEAFDRIDHALTESSTLLRSTMTELHPAVLEQSGLAVAVRELARTAAARGGFEMTIVDDGWPEPLRTTADPLLFATAREALTNIVKHAHATNVRVELHHDGSRARLVVRDDGVGLADGMLAQRLAEGHIGLASRRVRLEAVGGQLIVRAAAPTGTVLEAELPATARPSAPDLTRPT